MKTSTLILEVVQAVRAHVEPVLREMFAGRSVEDVLNSTDRALADSVLEGARLAFQQVLSQPMPPETGTPQGDIFSLQHYRVHTAVGCLDLARQICTQADGMVLGQLDSMQLLHGCTMAVREQSAFLVAAGTALEAREAMLMFRSTAPSESTIKRVVETDGVRMQKIWDDRAEEIVLERYGAVITEADLVSCGADGAMVPMRGLGGANHAGAEARTKGSRQPKAPTDAQEPPNVSAYREARLITVTLYGKPDQEHERMLTFHDEKGQACGECVGFQRPRLATILFGEMPSVHGPTDDRAKTALAMILDAIRSIRPHVDFRATCDGGTWPQETLDEQVGPDCRNSDFYHATEHLRTGSKAAYGDTPEATEWYKRKRTALLSEDGAAAAIAEELQTLSSLKPEHSEVAKTLKREAGYFRKRTTNMNYAELLRQDLIIGSGVTEASVKRLVTLRMKRVGASWKKIGGDAVMTLRSMRLSNLWDAAWSRHAANENARYQTAA